MVDPYDDLDWHPTKRRRAPAVFVALVASAMIAAAVAAYFWSQSHEDTVAPEAVATLQEIRLLQQQIAGRIDAIDQKVVAAQTDLKRLSGQLSALAARVDALNAAGLTSSMEPPSDARAQVPAPPSKKRLPAPKPTGPVSVGGAPQNAPPAPDQNGQR
jgi:uncharacterized protein HemX